MNRIALFLFLFRVIVVAAQQLPEYNSVDVTHYTPLQLAEMVAGNIIDDLQFEYEYIIKPVYPDIEVINFEKSIETDKSTVAYAVSTMFSEAKQKETIEIGSASRLKVWINDVLVFTGEGNHSFSVKFEEKTYILPDKFDVNLRKGENKILIKAERPSDGENLNVYMQSRNMGRYFDKGKRVQCSLKKYAPKIDIVHWLLLGPFEGSINTVFEPEEILVFHKLYQSGNSTFSWDIPHLDIITDNPANGQFYSWSYHVGCFVWGLQQLSKKTGNQKYARYADKWCEYTLSTMPLANYQTKELNAVRSMNWGTADRPMLDYTTAPSMPFIARIVDESDFPIREKYVEWTNKITHYITNRQFRLEDGVLARQYTVRPSVWADDMFMGIPYMLYAAKCTPDKSQRNMLYEDAARQIVLFNKYLFDSEKHLYMQACYADFPQKTPFWSRGNGWAIWATTEVLLNLPKNHRDYKKVMDIYRQHIDGLVNTQDNDGFWHNILDMPQTVRESSGSAIFTMAIARGINNNWLPRKKYLPILEKAWTTLLTFIDINGNMHGVKGGTNFSPDPEDYARTPFVKSDTHGVLPFLFACMEMEEIIKTKQ